MLRIVEQKMLTNVDFKPSDFRRKPPSENLRKPKIAGSIILYHPVRVLEGLGEQGTPFLKGFPSKPRLDF
jgi:hypothetical protein